MRWTEGEIEKIIELYSDKSNLELSNIFNRDENSIRNKANRLGLNKSKEHISKHISKRNKMVGRDMCYENVKKICLKYNSRGLLQQMDPSAYRIALMNGWLDEFSKHMIHQNFSIPQLILKYIILDLFDDIKILYNSRSIIKPYELDIYLHDYKIAFEYDGKGWHSKKDNKKIDNKKELLCEKNNIKLLRIIENNRNYFQDIMDQLKNNIKFLKYIDENITSSDLDKISEKVIMDKVNNSILNIDEIKDEISKYKNLNEFRTKNINLYNKLIKLNKSDLFDDLERKYNYWNVEKCKQLISNYKTLKDFRINNNGCYLFIKKNKLNFLLDNLIDGRKS